MAVPCFFFAFVFLPARTISFEESTSSESATPAPKTQHYTSWRSSTTPPTGGTSTVTTVSSGCSGSSAPATTTTTGSINSALVSGQRTGENRIHPQEDQPNGNNGMGTETILLPSGGAVGVHQQQQRRQQLSSATTTTNPAPPQSYLIDEETAFGDKLKGKLNWTFFAAYLFVLWYSFTLGKFDKLWHLKRNLCGCSFYLSGTVLTMKVIQ